MVEQSPRDVMQGREIRNRLGLYSVRRGPCTVDVRATFAAQSLDAVLFHLHMKQEPIGARPIPEGLERGDLRSGQCHGASWQIKNLPMPFEYIECFRERSEDRIVLSFLCQVNRRHADFECAARVYRGA